MRKETVIMPPSAQTQVTSTVVSTAQAAQKEEKGLKGILGRLFGG